MIKTALQVAACFAAVFILYYLSLLIIAGIVLLGGHLTI